MRLEPLAPVMCRAVAIAREWEVTVHYATLTSLAETLSAYSVTADAQYAERLTLTTVFFVGKTENKIW